MQQFCRRPHYTCHSVILESGSVVRLPVNNRLATWIEDVARQFNSHFAVVNQRAQFGSYAHLSRAQRTLSPALRFYVSEPLPGVPDLIQQEGIIYFA
jgi:hypothetical protein